VPREGAFTEIGARFRILDPCDPGFIRDLLGFDVVLSNLLGPYGEDGRLQGLLDYLRRPFCGSSVAAGAGLCGLSLADVVRAFLHEALTRPAYDVPLPIPVFSVGSAAVREPAA